MTFEQGEAVLLLLTSIDGHLADCSSLLSWLLVSVFFLAGQFAWRLALIASTKKTIL